MARNVIEILITAKDQTKKTLALTTKQLKEFARAAGVAGTAMVAVGVQMFKAASQADRLTTATDNLAKALGETGDEMITGITSAAKGMISDMQAAQAANQAMMFGIVENKEQMQELAQIAVVLGNAMGQDAGKSIEDMTLALGRQSKMILDNLGIIVNVEQAYEDYAESLGKTASALTDAEKQQAFTTAALEAGRAKAEELGGVAVDSAGKVDQLTSAWGNFYVEFGRVLTALNESTGALDVANGWIDRLTEGAKAWQQNLEDAAGWMDIQARAAENLGIVVGTQNAAIMQGKLTQDEWKEALAEAGKQLEAEAKSASYATTQLNIYKWATDEATKATWELAQAQAASDRSMAAQTARLQAQANAWNKGGEMGDLIGQSAGLDTTQMDDFRYGVEEIQEEFEDLPSTLTTSFDTIANDLSNRLSGAVGEAFGRMQQTVPGLDEMFGGGEEPGEFGRRLGALADGLQDSDQVFLEKFKEQAGGNPVYSALLTAIEEGDSAGVAAEANRLLNENLAMVIATGLKDSVVAQMREQEVLAEAQRILAEELGEPAGAAVTALEGVSTEAGTMKTKVGEATGAGVTGTNKWIARINELNRVLGNTNGLLEDVDSKMNKVAPVGDGTSIEQIGGMIE
jgi:hypothetical protein